MDEKPTLEAAILTLAHLLPDAKTSAKSIMLLIT